MSEHAGSTEEPPLRVFVSRRSVGLVLLPLFLAVLGIPMALTVQQHLPWAIPLVVAGVFATLVATMLASMARVVVGKDGVRLTALGERRYFAFRDLASAEEIDGEKIRLSLRSGGHWDLITQKDQNVGKERYEKACEALLSRIQAGIEAHRGLGDDRAARAESLVARAKNPAQPRYRVAEQPTEDELWAVVEDDAVAPEVRARAALALRSEAGQEGRARLLRIAEGTAEPALSEALRGVAEAEDDARAEAEIEGLMSVTRDRGSGLR